MVDQMPERGLSTPNPDPTRLTTEALLREVAAVRELFESRMAAFDKSVQSLQNQINVIPAQRAETLEHLKLLLEEKLASVQVQFRERDVRVDQAHNATKLAVEAALQAQKESSAQQNAAFIQSMDKTEKGFTKQIDQLGETIAAKTEGLDGKIDDLKTRLTTSEGKGQGVNLAWGAFISLIGVIATVGTLISIASVFLNK